MDSSESSPLDSFKSKKILQSSLTPTPSDQNLPPHTDPDSDPNAWSSKTPEKKPIIPSRRIRNPGAAISLKEVRQAAKNLQEPGPDLESIPDPLMTSAKQGIPIWPDDSPFKLPEKYYILDKFFSSLDSSIRLLRMKGSMTTFTNISPKIECLTDRRFTYSHLAQLKFILPEAIEIKKILMHDERTNCMKPDLFVALHVDAVIENNGKKKSESGNVQLRKVFHSRLLDFSKFHPEGDEVPEEVLPEPFNQSKKDLQTNLSRTPDSFLVGETPAVALSEQQPSAASHLSRSFTRRFSQNVTSHETGQSKQQEKVVTGHASVLPVSVPHFAQVNLENNTCISAAKVPMELCSKPSSAESSSNRASSAGLPPSPLPSTPVKDINSYKCVDCPPKETAATQETPSGPACTSAKLMSNTPVLQPPKRCYMSPDDDLTQSPYKLVRRPSRSRSLKFDTPVKSATVEDDVQEAGCSAVDDEVLDILPENLVQSIREKEREAFLEQDPAIPQAKWHQRMLASLPKLFDIIYFLFQSIRHSVITKEELMHKLVSSQLDIVDRREVEEQLTLLQELVPEWIYEKSSYSGDILLCVNKIPSPEILRTRLAEAN